MVSIKEDFRSYAAPSWTATTVIRLLQSLPPTHLVGLSSIVLTETASTAGVKIRRKGGRKYSPKDRLGFYRPDRSGGAATIYLIVDNILTHEGDVWLQAKRDVIMADVLFHEVGHHLNAKMGLIARNEEASAEAWSLKLWRLHIRRRYSFLIPVLRMVHHTASLARRRRYPQRS
jgi:hypothetical protein